MKIEVLTFDGCPNTPRALDLVRDVVEERGVDAEVEFVEVAGLEEAQRLGFPGSPTIRVDGVDVEPGAEGRSPVFGCRLYRTPSNLPERGWIVKALTT